ncbi:MAG: hypothetical protein P8M34_14695 [Saprospiraceae bacterium]|nr:hypothetical protein [Saprospiraceae bacterium]
MKKIKLLSIPNTLEGKHALMRSLIIRKMGDLQQTKDIANKLVEGKSHIVEIESSLLDDFTKELMDNGIGFEVI